MKTSSLNLKDGLKGLNLPNVIKAAITGHIVKEDEFMSAIELLKDQIMHTKDQYGRDVHQNVVKIGDFLGRYENGNISVYVVCAESRATFYLARYVMLQNFISGDINSVADIRNSCSGQVLKQNCGKSIRVEAESINEVIRDQMLKLQEKIIEFYNE